MVDINELPRDINEIHKTNGASSDKKNAKLKSLKTLTCNRVDS